MLNIVSVPIGNLGDITHRAVKALDEAEIVLCEDTRVTAKLYNLLGIKNKPQMVSFYDEVEESKIPKIVDWLNEDRRVVLVSDAGTPLLSDPGWKLVKRCRELNLKYSAIPGACAAVNGLVLSGLPSGRFAFLGFLPKKSGERKRLLEKYQQIEGSKIVYESPFRVKRLVEEIKEVCGEEVVIRLVFEMTKIHEQVMDGSQVGDYNRGEVTVIFC